MIKLRSYQKVDLDNIIEDQIYQENWEFLSITRKGYIDIEKILNYQKNFSQSHFDTIVLIGMGGSMLGAQAIYKIMDEKIDQSIKVHFVDNLDPYEVNKILKKIIPEKTLIITVSKSGNTPETMANYYLFNDFYKKKKLDLSEHFLYICDEGSNNLRNEAEKNNGIVFDIPKKLGGRYSVLSNAGLVFASLIGLDIKEILFGAQMVVEKFENDKNNNESSILAKNLFEAYTKNNQKIFCLFPYFNRGSYLAKWFVQLFAESLGKSEEVSPTPIYAVGSTDQHSILQLFKEGKNDKYFIFLELLAHGEDPIDIPKIYNKNLDYLSKLEFEHVLNTQMQATIDSLLESNRGISKITISQLTEENLGFLFMFFQVTCAVLGDMFGIDTFNQPGVERSKVLTVEYLTERRG